MCRRAWFYKALPITPTGMGNKNRMIPHHDPVVTPEYSQIVNYEWNIVMVYCRVYY